MFYVTRRFKFDAAHKIDGHYGKCKNRHGHCWHVEVTYKGKTLDNIGMLIDFGHIKARMEEILKYLDHSDLNDKVEFRISNPTAENIALYIFNWLFKYNMETVKLHSVKVWESEDSYAEYKEYNE